MSYITELFPSSIVDIHDKRHEQDQAYVDCIIATIKFQIYVYMEDYIGNTFDYDTLEWIDGLDQTQQSRIIDRVVRYFRKNGIMVTIAGTYTYNSYQTNATDNFNMYLIDFTTLTVKFTVREEREYMKAYFN